RDLPGTLRELDKVLERAGKRQARRLTGTKATTARLLAELPEARWAHLATHGFFADKRFRSILQIDEKLFDPLALHEGPPPGARNVVASLWKVNDDATAALMALFYDKLWRQNKPPLQALREAQLTLYHHPERVKALARERGPNFDKVVRLPVQPAQGKPRQG